MWLSQDVITREQVKFRHCVTVESALADVDSRSTEHSVTQEARSCVSSEMLTSSTEPHCDKGKSLSVTLKMVLGGKKVLYIDILVFL
jgi:hypothetical protein